MNDKMKFHNMTKPMKFRRLKVLKQYVVLWCMAQRERILYLFNYLLYKLNILKRYSYRDSVEKSVPFPHKIAEMGVESECFRGIVEAQLVVVRDIDLDYFYREKKDGSKKITYKVTDFCEERLYMESHLRDIHIGINNVWFDTHSMPTFKSYINPQIKPFNPEKPLEEVRCDTICFDLTKVNGLYCKYYIGHINVDELSKEMLKFYYEDTCNLFRRKLNTIKLEDLTRR